MTGDASGWLWFVIGVAFIPILAGIMIYGGVQWRRRGRDRGTQEIRDRATRRVYDDPKNTADQKTAR